MTTGAGNGPERPQGQREQSPELDALLHERVASELPAHRDPHPPTRRQQLATRAMVLTAALMIGGISIGSVGAWRDFQWWDQVRSDTGSVPPVCVDTITVTLAATPGDTSAALAGTYASTCTLTEDSADWWIVRLNGDTMWADFGTADSLLSWLNAGASAPLLVDSTYVANFRAYNADGSEVAIDTLTTVAPPTCLYATDDTATIFGTDLNYASKAAALAALPNLEQRGTAARNDLSADVPTGCSGKSWWVNLPVAATTMGGVGVLIPGSYPFGSPPLQDTTYPATDMYLRYAVKFDSGYTQQGGVVACTGGSAGLKLTISSKWPSFGRDDVRMEGSDPPPDNTYWNLLVNNTSPNAWDGVNRPTAYYLNNPVWEWHAGRRRINSDTTVVELWIDGVPVHSPDSATNSPAAGTNFYYNTLFGDTYNCAAVAPLVTAVSYKFYGFEFWNPTNPSSGAPAWYIALPDSEKVLGWP